MAKVSEQSSSQSKDRNSILGLPQLRPRSLENSESWFPQI